jgi:hypothetical protein
MSESLNNFFINNPITSIWLGWSIAVLIICFIIYHYDNKKKLTKEQYLLKLKEIGYDISNSEQAIKNAEIRYRDLQKQLKSAYDKGYIEASNQPCPTLCGFRTRRNYYNCCKREYERSGNNSKEIFKQNLTENDKLLLKYYEYYTQSNNLKFLLNLFVGIVMIPGSISLIVAVGPYFAEGLILLLSVFFN